MADATHITIAGREIGEGRPCFVIAEAGINHNGDTALAAELVDAAAAAGADAIKFQTHFPEHEMLRGGATAVSGGGGVARAGVRRYFGPGTSSSWSAPSAPVAEVSGPPLP